MSAHRLPPRALEDLLHRLLASSTPSAPFVVGDLREEYAARTARGSALSSNVWYVLSGALLVTRLRWEQLRPVREAEIAAPRPTPSRLSPGDLMRNELKQAVRFLARRPGFSSAIVLTVALAIAATTVAYAVVDGVLLEPLPYRDPDGLVVVWEHNLPRDRVDNVVSPSNFLEWRERATSFERLASAVGYSGVITSGEEPERAGAVQASAELFRLIEAQPLIGRLYGPEDDVAGAERVVVLSERYWRSRYGGDPGVLGRTMHMNGVTFTIIGVLPDRFDIPIAFNVDGPGTHDIWTAPQFGEEARAASGRYLQVFGRLRPGVTLDGARAEMTAIAAQLRAEFPVRQAGWDITVRPLSEQVVGDIRTTLLIIFGAVCFVLLIACGNVANLLLTRATARQQEMAVRSALGAARGRLLRQLLSESLLLSVAGGIAGFAIAYWLLRALVAAAPDIPRIEALGLDASVVAFALVATIGTALLFGLAPALHVLGGNLSNWLRDRGAGQTRKGGNRLRSALVVAQVALSLVLLVGAGLLIRSFANRLSLGLGFDTERVLTAELRVPGDRYSHRDMQAQFFEDLVTRLQALPGVTAASAITFAPLAGGGSATSFWQLDRPRPREEDLPTGDIRWVHRDYHRAMGIPLTAGRYFDESDHTDAPLRIVINESGARQLWPNENAIGKRIAMPWGDTLNAEVIGVVGDVLFNGPETELRPMLYWDHRQFQSFRQMTLLLRAQGDPTALVPAIREAVRAMDPQLPVYNVRSVDELYADALARPRFATVALSLFAALGLLLAGIGIYGVIAYVTQQRSREIGIRLALGAGRGEVQRMVLAQGAGLIAVAIVIGAAGALGVTRLLQGLVFDISTTDPLTFAAMAALLAAIALVACWIPARRASTIDPVEAIRYD
jgi:putative ABC transport system permease protein